MGNFLKQAQKLQVEASSGGGAVKVTVNGKQEILSLKINPEVLASPDKEMLEDLILAACNEGLKKSRELMAEELSKLTGGLPLPPGLL